MPSNDPKLSHGHRTVTPKCNCDNQISYPGRNARRGGRWLQRGVRHHRQLLVNNQIDDYDVRQHYDDDAADKRPHHRSCAFLLSKIDSPSHAPNRLRNPNSAILLAKIKTS